MPKLIERIRDALQGASDSPLRQDKQFLQGKLTFLGIAISAFGALSNFFGLPVPVQEIRDIADWLRTHWDTLTELAGLVVAAYGRLRLNWRKGDA